MIVFISTPDSTTYPWLFPPQYFITLFYWCSHSFNETEKLVYENISKENQLIRVIKDKIEISNKAWDKAIKSLRKLELIKVEKIENDIYISKIN